MEKHKEILSEGFVMRDVRGERIEGRIVGVEPFEMGPEGLHMNELMEHTVLYKIEYALREAPEFLTFSVDFSGGKSLLPGIMVLTVTQEGWEKRDPVEVMAGAPRIFRFDWDRPPVRSALSLEEWEKRRVELRKETLGITSYSSVYSFIYIDDHEVRHEILIPLLTLESWFKIDRKEEDFLEVEEQLAARDRIAEFFAGGNPVEIDGIRVKPVLTRLDFYGLDFRDFAQMAPRRRLAAANARIGVILSYATKGTPSRVKITWDRFNWQVYEVRSSIFAYEEAHEIIFHPTYRKSFAWTDPGRPAAAPPTAIEPAPTPVLSLPVLSLSLLALSAIAPLVMGRRGAPGRRCLIVAFAFLLCAVAAWPLARVDVAHPLTAGPALSAAETRSLFAALLRNVYRAFDYRSEEDIYDALAESADGELLRDLYLRIMRGLEMREQGGAVSRIREVKIVEGEMVDRGKGEASGGRGFRYRCLWTVDGTVEHWGHIHSRINEYEAIFDVRVRGGAWKLTGFDFIQERRLRYETSLRELK